MGPWGAIEGLASVLYKFEESGSPVYDTINPTESFSNSGAVLYQVGTTNGTANGIETDTAKYMASDSATSYNSHNIGSNDAVIELEFKIDSSSKF